MLNFNSTSIGFWEGLSKGMNWLLLITLPVFINPALYGEVVVFVAYLLLISNAGILGQNKVVLRYVENFQDENLFGSIVIVAAATIVVLSVFLFFFDGTWLTFALIILASLLFVFYNLFVAVFRKLDSVSFCKFRVSYTLTRLILGLGLVYKYETASSYLLAEIVALSLAYTYTLFTADRLSSLHFSLSKVSMNIRLGAPLAVHAMSIYILGYFDRLVMALFLTDSEIGNYSLVYMFSSSLMFVYAVQTVIWEPKIYRSKLYEKAILVSNSLLYRMLVFSFLASILLSIVYFIFLPMLNTNYEVLTEVFVLLMVGHLLLPFYYLNNYLLVWKGDTKSIAVCSIAAGLLNIVLNFSLIPIYGVAGAAFSTLLSYFLLVLFSEYARRRAQKKDISSVGEVKP